MRPLRIALWLLAASALLLQAAGADPAGQAVTVAMLEKQTLAVNNATRILCVNPEKISAVLSDPNTVLLEGREIGQTYLHVWDQNGLTTYRVVVTHPIDKQVLDTGVVITSSGVEEPPFKPFSVNLRPLFNYTSNGSRVFDSSNNTMQYEAGIDLEGGTPAGDLLYSMDYDWYNALNVNKSYVARTYLHLTKDRSTLEAGDMLLRDSEMTLPFVFFQGARFKYLLEDPATRARTPEGGGYYSLFNPNKDYVSFTAGAGGHKYWGDQSSIFPPLSPNFYGAEVGKNLLDGDHFLKADVYASAQDSITNPKYDTGQVYANQLVALSDQIRINRNVDLMIETAANEQNAMAYKVGPRGNWENLSLYSYWRHYDPEFNSVAGNLSYQGQQGLYTGIVYQPYQFVKYNGMANVYQDHYRPNPLRPDYYNRDLTNMLEFFFGKWFNYDLMYHHNDQTGTISPYISDTVENRLHRPFYINKTFERFEPYVSASFTKQEQETLISQPVNHITDYAVGFDLAYLQYSTAYTRLTLETSDDPYYGETDHNQFFEAGNSIHYPLNRAETLCLNHTLSFLRYVYPDITNSTVTGSIGITYRPDDTFSVNTNLSIGHSQSGEDQFYNTGLYLQGNYRFCTSRRWRPKVNVDVFVFKDDNANGKFDKGEKPLGSVAVLLETKTNGKSEKRTLVTGPGGKVDLGDIRCDWLQVSVDDPALRGYVFTTNGIYALQLKDRNTPMHCEFGVFGAFKVRGRVFDDSNLNGVYDEGVDMPLHNVRLMAGETRPAFSDTKGVYFLDRLREGPQTITVAVDTLPNDSTLAGQHTYTVYGLPGQTLDLDFPVVSVRSLAGVLYADTNRNGRLDPGEPTFEDVTVGVGKNTTVTNAKGEFLIKQIPAGTFTLEVDPDTLPAGYTLDGPLPSVTIQNGPGAYAAEIRIKKKAPAPQARKSTRHSNLLAKAKKKAPAPLSRKTGASTSPKKR